MKKNFCPICNGILLVKDSRCKNDIIFPYKNNINKLNKNQLKHLTYHKNNYKWNDERKNNHSNTIKKLCNDENSNYSKEDYSKRMTEFNNKNWNNGNFKIALKNNRTIKRKINAGKRNWKRKEYIQNKKNFEINKMNKIKNLLLCDYNYILNNSDNYIDYENIINPDNFDNLKSIPGVWALWGENIETGVNECLTVGQSINVGKELNWTLRVLANEKLQDLERENPGCTGRWDRIQSKYKNYYYILVNKNEYNKNSREKLEMDYALKNNSIYWKPNPFQLNIYNKILI